jgi:hypothetical protein
LTIVKVSCDVFFVTAFSEEAERYLSDIELFPEFCERFLRLQPTRGSHLVPFKFTPIQKYLHEKYVEPKYKAGEPVRLAVLKARQHGVSTYSNALSYWNTIAHHHWNTLIIGEDSDQAVTLFRMARRFHENSPWGREDPDTTVFPLFPLKRDSMEALEFDHPSRTHRHKLYANRDDVAFLDSRMEIRSSESKSKLGRAGFYHTVHASEVARWPRVFESLIALMACSHPEPHSAVIIECTANGMNEFYNWWMNLSTQEEWLEHAVAGTGVQVAQWEKLFIPWYWDHRYEITPKKIKKEFIDQYEQDLFYRIHGDSTLQEIDPGVTFGDDRIWAKLFWRRWAIKNISFSNEELFKQDYPSTESEAFIFSGTSVYPPSAIGRMEGTVKDPLRRGEISLQPITNSTPQDKKMEAERTLSALADKQTYVHLMDHERGKFRVWEDPQPGEKYCVFADVAEGKAVEGITEDRSKWDFSCAQVFKVTSYPPAMEQVAIWHGNCDPDEFGDVLVAIARLYNKAYLGWEINGPGRSIGLQVVRHHRYSNIYLREDYDSLTKRNTKKPGWRTTARSKPDMVATSQRFVREHELLIRDAATVAECKSFSRIGENKFGAAQGHDDRVIAMCGMCAIIEGRIMQIKRLAEFEKQKKQEAEAHDFRKDRRDFMNPNPNENFNPVLGDEY